VFSPDSHPMCYMKVWASPGKLLSGFQHKGHQIQEESGGITACFQRRASLLRECKLYRARILSLLILLNSAKIMVCLSLPEAARKGIEGLC